MVQYSMMIEARGSPDYSYTVVFNVQSSIDFEKKKLYILIFK